jgi:hypothetical protein
MGISDDSFTNAFPTTTGDDYSPDSVAFLNSIEKEAACFLGERFKYASPGELRVAVGSFSYKKWFENTPDGCALLCRRCHEPDSQKRK